MITIYGNNGDVVYKGNAVVAFKERLMGEHSLTISIVTADIIPFAFGCYADAKNERFYLYQQPSIKVMESYCEYTVVLESVKYELIRAEQHSFGASEFSLTTDLKGWLDLIVTNISRVASGWTYTIMDETEESVWEYKTIDVTGETTLASLNRVSTDWGMEFYVSGRHIYVGKKGITHSISLQVGRWKGLYDMTLESISDQNPITRLYLYGSERNIPASYNNAAGETYTKRLVVDAVNGGKRYIESANKAKYGINELSKTFSDIYPHRTGTVTGVTDVLTFADSSIDFDINAQMIAGLSPKVSFKTGSLAGYEFELTKYTNSSKTIKLKETTDGAGITIPNATLKPAVGDKYVLLDIAMPQSYITAAENELLAAGIDWMTTQKNDDYQVKYSVTSLDVIHQKANGFYPSAGDYVNIKDVRLGIDRLIRIVEVNIDLTGDDEIYKSIELSDNIEPTTLQKFVQDNKKQDSVIRVNDKRRKEDIRRGYQAMDEMKANIFDQDGYFDLDNIRPFSIETMMISTGAKDSKMTLNNVGIYANYQGNYNRVYVTAGTLTHFAIPDDSGFTWQIQAATTNIEDDALRYIYAKCATGDNSASIIFDTNKLSVEGSGFYYFLIGTISSVIDGTRIPNLTYGQGSMVGEQLNIGKVNDPQGNLFLDINTRKIYGQVTFESGSSGLKNLDEWDEVVDDVTSKASVYDTKIISSNGDEFQNGNIDTTLTALVFKGAEDITSTLNLSCFRWVRKSSDASADAIWNNQHATFYSNVINITEDDVYGKAVFNCIVTIPTT